MKTIILNREIQATVANSIEVQDYCEKFQLVVVKELPDLLGDDGDTYVYTEPTKGQT